MKNAALTKFLKNVEIKRRFEDIFSKTPYVALPNICLPHNFSFGIRFIHSLLTPWSSSKITNIIIQKSSIQVTNKEYFRIFILSHISNHTHATLLTYNVPYNIKCYCIRKPSTIVTFDPQEEYPTSELG
jgi:hypothetical protein